jgi:hypothetical protein
MKPSELFGVFVRAAGFVIVLYGLYEIWDGFENAVENLFPANQTDDGQQVSTFAFFAFGIPSLVLGTLIFFLADWIVKVAYRDRSH